MPQQSVPLFYSLSYSYLPVSSEIARQCENKQPSVRVLPLHAVAPYNNTKMVVEIPPVEIRQSESHRWIANPAYLFRDWLIRDTSSDGIVYVLESTIVGHNDFYNVSGRIEKWSLISLPDGGYRAALTVLLQVWKKSSSAIVFSKRYSYLSENVGEKKPEVFAELMSKLVVQASSEFRRDLYTALLGKCTEGF